MMLLSEVMCIIGKEGEDSEEGVKCLVAVLSRHNTPTLPQKANYVGFHFGDVSWLCVSGGTCAPRTPKYLVNNSADPHFQITPHV